MFLLLFHIVGVKNVLNLSLLITLLFPWINLKLKMCLKNFCVTWNKSLNYIMVVSYSTIKDLLKNFCYEPIKSFLLTFINRNVCTYW